MAVAIGHCSSSVMADFRQPLTAKQNITRLRLLKTSA